MTPVERDYSRSVIGPPAPVCTITLRPPYPSEEELQIEMLIDTGASCTCIPSEDALGDFAQYLLYAGVTEVTGISGSVLTRVYHVNVSVEGLNQVVVRAVAIDHAALLGRDVLNTHRVVLDGPGLSCTIEQSGTAQS